MNLYEKHFIWFLYHCGWERKSYHRRPQSSPVWKWFWYCFMGKFVFLSFVHYCQMAIFLCVSILCPVIWIKGTAPPVFCLVHSQMVRDALMEARFAYIHIYVQNVNSHLAIKEIWRGTWKPTVEERLTIVSNATSLAALQILYDYHENKGDEDK